MSRGTRSIARRAASTLASVPWWVWAIAGVALVLRLAIVSYGLPYEFDPDERLFVDAAWRMVESGSPDPHWYNAPASTLIDTLAILYAAYDVGGVLFGAFDGVVQAGDAYRADVTHFFLVGRIVSAISGVAVVLMTYAVVRELRSSAFWAVVAASMVALSFPMVQFSSLIRMDMLLITFLLAIVLVMLRALERPSGSAFVVAGALLGLAVTSKYPGALGLVPILLANTTLVFEGRVAPRRGLLWLAAAAVASLVAAFVVAPYLFFNAYETLAAIALEARPTHLGATGSGPLHNLWAYLTDALPGALGTIGATLGVVGLAVMVALRRPRLTSLTFWAYLVFISVLSLWWHRWALPLVPLAAIGAAFLLDHLDSRVREWRPGRWLVLTRATVACLLVLPLVAPTITNIQAQALNDDTRLKAIDWLHANVPDGSTLLIDSYTTQVSSDRYDVLIADGDELVRWSNVNPKLRPDGFFGVMASQWDGTPDELLQAIETERVDFIILTDLWIDLFRDEAATYPAQLATYEALLDAFPVVEVFDGADAPIGWPITILQASGGIATD